MNEPIIEYKKALTIGKIGFWEWDAVTNVTYWGDEKFKIFGYEPQEFEVTFEKAFSTMHPDDVPTVMALLQKKMPTHQQFDYEYRGIHKQGHIINVWVRVEVIRDSEGKPIGLSGISQDITERKKLEEEIKLINSSLENQVAQRTADLKSKVKENELLLKEMHHRVKNNLQIISSILRLQKDYLNDDLAITSLEECISRIKSMSLIHESLYARENLSFIDLKLYFEQLVEYHLHGDSKIKENLNLTDIKLEIGKMLPLGMIINELILNSVKHAFINEDKPEIGLSIDKTNNILNIKYTDNGIGIDVFETKSKPSFGLDLIKTLLNDLDSEIHFETSKEGFRVNFSVSI
jgi:PAS domain S-box-containing protein